MSRTVKTQFYWIVMTFVAIAIGLSGCADQNFSTDPGNIKGSPDPLYENTDIGDVNASYVTTEVSGDTVTQTFNIAKIASRKIDMVWAIDNSGSMSEEAANVRANFTSFASTLGSKTNLKLALLSTSTGSFGVKLSLTGTAYRQIDRAVQSWDPLGIAALASCPAELTNMSEHILCGKRDTTFSQARFSQGDTTFFPGKLADFFRSDAHRIYVVVTDDNALGVNAANFISLVRTGGLKADPTVFGFIGTNSRSGCSVASPGQDYMKLASATGGTTFDICERDWKPYFSKLTSDVEEIANTEFILQRAAQVITAVKVDGVEIPKTGYSHYGQKVRVNRDRLQTTSQKVQIIYVQKSS